VLHTRDAETQGGEGGGGKDRSTPLLQIGGKNKRILFTFFISSKFGTFTSQGAKAQVHKVATRIFGYISQNGKAREQTKVICLRRLLAVKKPRDLISRAYEREIDVQGVEDGGRKEGHGGFRWRNQDGPLKAPCACLAAIAAM
jgi:hypothetical protein